MGEYNMIGGGEIQELYNRAEEIEQELVYLRIEAADAPYDKHTGQYDDTINNKEHELALIKQTIENYGGIYE